jgi:predicted DNA-binding transcriptional regulator YafY
MMGTSARLLRLLSLLQQRRDWSGADLAQRLEVTTRTVRRDVEKLRSLGYPVHGSTGLGGGYRLGAGAALPPLLLDDDEAVAVAVGLRTAAGGTVSGIEETSVRALAKLEQVLPARLRQRVGSLGGSFISLGGGAPTVDADLLTSVAVACRDHLRLPIRYRSRDGSLTDRTVEPHRLVHTGRRWYLVAWDVQKGQWRTFRVDRLTPRPPAGPRFNPREPPEDFGTYASRSISTAVYRYHGDFTVHTSAAELAEIVPPTAGTIEPIDDTTCRLVAGSNSLDQMAIYIGLLGFDFDVNAPTELREFLATLGARLTRASAATTDAGRSRSLPSRTRRRS